MRRLVAILAYGVSLLGLAACSGGGSGSSLVPQQLSPMDQGVPLLSRTRHLRDQGVPLLSKEKRLADQGVPLLSKAHRRLADQGVPLL
jgi:hypothetical protein